MQKKQVEVPIAPKDREPKKLFVRDRGSVTALTLDSFDGEHPEGDQENIVWGSF